MSRALTVRALALLSALALSACDYLSPDQGADPTGNAMSNQAAAIAARGGPPPPPPYQMRAELAEGDRLDPSSDGKMLFSNRCGACHLLGGMGTNVLTAQQVAQGKPPTAGLLANRDDLTADYVKAVVRSGKGAMPPQTRVDITDAELDKVAAYLGKAQ